MHSHVTSRALDYKGIVGPVSLDGTEISAPWSHVIGLAGEQHGAGGTSTSNLPAVACDFTSDLPLLVTYGSILTD